MITASFSLALLPFLMIYSGTGLIMPCLLTVFANGILMFSAHTSATNQINLFTVLCLVGPGCYMFYMHQSIRDTQLSDNPTAVASNLSLSAVGCGSGTGYVDSEINSGDSPLDTFLKPLRVPSCPSNKRARHEATHETICMHAETKSAAQTPNSLTEGARKGSDSLRSLPEISGPLVSALTQVSKDALLLMDPPTGQLIGINDLFCELLHTLGLNNSIVGDMLLKQFLHSHMKPPRFVGMIKTTDGRECHLDVTMAMIQNHQRSQIMCSIRDITNKITTMDLYAQLLANQEQCQVELF